METGHKIIGQIRKAQADPGLADEFIRQYMPFIRSESAGYLKRPLTDGDDELSIAMFAFYEAMMAYQPERGAFLKLASVAIKNRLIDYSRKEKRHDSTVSLDQPAAGSEEGRTIGETIADEKDHAEELLSREAACKEIEHFTREIGEYGLSLSDIADNCPKQERTMKACLNVLGYALRNGELIRQMEKTRKLPLSVLAEGAKVEKKTLERHRKYIMGLMIAYTNGFELIRSHLKKMRGTEVQRG